MGSAGVEEKDSGRPSRDAGASELYPSDLQGSQKKIEEGETTSKKESNMIQLFKKENGFIVKADDGREIVVEGSDPKKLGAAVLAMFKTPRKPRVKKEA